MSYGFRLVSYVCLECWTVGEGNMQVPTGNHEWDCEECRCVTTHQVCEVSEPEGSES